MQLSLSADVVVPVGVGVLVAIVAAVVLVIGLRRKVEDEPAPTHDDWTGEHVAEAQSSARQSRPVWTVADAVAARQIVTDPAAVSSSEVMPDRGDAAEIVESGEEGPVGVPAVNGTAVISTVNGTVNGTCLSSAGAQAPREAASDRTVESPRAPQTGWLRRMSAWGSIALADPVTVGGTASRPIAVGGAAPVTPSVVTSQARHSRPADDGGPEESAPNSSLGGSSGDVSFGGRSWLAGALGSASPEGPGRRADGPIGGSTPPGAGADHRSDPPVDHGPGEADSTPSAEPCRSEDGQSGETTSSAASTDNVGESCPAERGPHVAPPQPTPAEDDGLDAWVASLPGVGPAGGRPVAGSAGPLPGDDRLEAGAAEFFPGARQPADERMSSAESSPGARRPADERPQPSVDGSLPGARRPVDDQLDQNTDGPLPDARRVARERPAESVFDARRPADDQDPGAPDALPGARRTADERPEPSAEGSLPGARRPVDDHADPSASQPGARRPDERLNTGSGGSLPADGQPVDDRLDPGQEASLPGARQPVDERPDAAAGGPSATQPVDHRSVADGTEPASAAGSSQSVAAAVAQVLAARAAAHTPDADRRGDARDRLLAVLLDDPLRAVGAAVDLQECQERIDRVAATLQDERGRLGDVLARLARSGLRPDQLARLSGLSDAEVAELLRRGLGG